MAQCRSVCAGFAFPPAGFEQGSVVLLLGEGAPCPEREQETVGIIIRINQLPSKISAQYRAEWDLSCSYPQSFPECRVCRANALAFGKKHVQSTHTPWCDQISPLIHACTLTPRGRRWLGCPWAANPVLRQRLPLSTAEVEPAAGTGACRGRWPRVSWKR